MEIEILMKKREMGQKCAESIYAELRILDKLSLETKKNMKKREVGQICAECILTRLRT